MKEEKKERTMWQKLVRGFWITLGSIVAIFVIGVITLSNTGPGDEEDITDNQEYVFQVTHGTTTYTYYCSGYKRNLVNGSYILIDYNGKPTAEVVITNGAYFRIIKNENYNPEYFKKEVEKEKVAEKKVIS